MYILHILSAILVWISVFIWFILSFIILTPITLFLWILSDTYDDEVEIEAYETILIQDKVTSPWKHKYIKLHDTHTHYLHVPCTTPCEDIVPLLFIHGTASSCVSFVDALDLFAETYDVYVVDLPGFGRSTCDGEVTDERLCEYLHQFMTSLFRDRPVILCGHSYGAYVCVHVARLYPHLLSKLVLLHPAGIFPTLGWQGNYWAIVFKCSILHLTRWMGRRGLHLVRTYCSDLPAILYWYTILSDNRHHGNIHVQDKITLTFLTSYWNQPMYDILHIVSSQIPTLILYGEHDPIIPAHQASVLEQTLSCTVKITPDVGHHPFSTVFATRSIRNHIMTTCTKRDIHVNEHPTLFTDAHLYASSFYPPFTTQIIDTVYAHVRNKHHVFRKQTPHSNDDSRHTCSSGK
jgi:pimeloyl-ACP methyl ester carboxylesterase